MKLIKALKIGRNLSINDKVSSFDNVIFIVKVSFFFRIYRNRNTGIKKRSRIQKKLKQKSRNLIFCY